MQAQLLQQVLHEQREPAKQPGPSPWPRMCQEWGRARQQCAAAACVGVLVGTADKGSCGNSSSCSDLRSCHVGIWRAWHSNCVKVALLCVC